ncbi:MAG TPA: hypothetical protein VLT45_00125 [Kofleriaceae bacterium]|nr:hypothetical protein [Kofleriaceae bacterium]
MVPALMSAIAERFPGARETDGRVEIAIGGSTYRARVAMEPVGNVSVQVPATDGFELAVRWTDRGTTATRAPTFDDSFLVETNDVALANAWLDPEVREALIASRYVAGTSPLRDTALLLRDGSWEHELRGDEVTARRLTKETSAVRITDMLAASLAIASRPARWAKTFAALGRRLGAQTATRIELGGKPILRVRRGAAEVTVRFLRRLGPADAGRLRLVVSAHRVGSAGETLTLIDEGLPRAAWPPANERGGGTLRIDERARGLLDHARPSTTIVRPHDIELTFDGGAADLDRLGAAIELAGYWAAPATTPYR